MIGEIGKLSLSNVMVEWIDHIAVIVTGLGTVLGVLALLWVACALIGAPFARGGTSSGAGATLISFGEPRSGIPPEHVAAISAAVTAVMDGPHRIVRISAPSHRPPGWSLEGRFESFGAHRMPWDRWPRVTTKGQRRKNR